MASVPLGSVAWSATALRDSLRNVSRRERYSNNASPAGVNRTVFPVRFNSLSPYSSSSWRIWALTAGCERNSFWPAREKLLSLTTSRNVVSWSKSMVLGDDYTRAEVNRRPDTGLYGRGYRYLTCYAAKVQSAIWIGPIHTLIPNKDVDTGQEVRIHCLR